MSSAGQRTSLQVWPIDAAGIAACGVLTLVVYFLAIQPSLRRQETRQMQQEALTATRDKLAQTAATVVTLKAELAQLQQITAERPIQLLSASASNQRLADLTKLAAEHHLRIDQLKTGDVRPAGSKFEIVPIQISGAGSFQACAAFLHSLHAQFPDTGISAMELADNPGDPTAQAGFRFDLTWYAAPALSSAEK